MRLINTSAFRVARRGTSREINRQIALNLIRARQPISRADLARAMGMRPGPVSLLVTELLDSGLVFEGEKGTSKSQGGRKPVSLYIETRRRCALAVDVSATRTSVMVTDLLGQPLLDVRDFATPRRPQSLVKSLVQCIRKLFADHPDVGECVGLGVVVSGIVDPARGRLRYSPGLGWRDVDLVAPLKAATKLPVVVENSCKACVLAQVWSVTGETVTDGPVAFVNVSDGTGVGIAVDGKLVRGAADLAGEFGHLSLDRNGPLCSCGQKGCWETYVSKRAVTARYLGVDASWPDSADLSGPTVRAIIAGARAGEARAIATLQETASYLGLGFSMIIKSIDPRRIYVGGEITEAWDILEPKVREALREQALIPGSELNIVVVPLGDHPRLRGAAALVTTPAFAAPTVA